MNKTHLVYSFLNINQTGTLPSTRIHLAYLHSTKPFPRVCLQQQLPNTVNKTCMFLHTVFPETNPCIHNYTKHNKSANSIFASLWHPKDPCIRPPRQKAVESKNAKEFEVPETHLMTSLWNVPALSAADHPAKRRLRPNMQEPVAPNTQTQRPQCHDGIDA